MASDAANALALLVGRNIRAARVERGFNGRQLAEALKVLNPQRAPTAQRVSDWERGVQQPDSGYMQALSETLERPVAWFYSEHEAETPEPFAANDSPIEDRLGAIEEAIRRLNADLVIRDAEVLRRIEEGVSTILDSLPGQQP